MSLPAGDLLTSLQSDLTRLAAGRHHDPHGVLGPHLHGSELVVLAHIPSVASVRIDGGHRMTRVEQTDFFVWAGPPRSIPPHYRLHWTDGRGSEYVQVDPYSFGALTSAEDLSRLGTGDHVTAWRMLGAHLAEADGIAGTRFSVWAPNAERVSVVGPFCLWDGRRCPMRSLGSSGVWELFVPGIGAHELYKYEIRNRDSGVVALKTDPYARATELRPSTAAVVAPRAGHQFRDAQWLAQRQQRDWLRAPMSIYELHAGSWRRSNDGGFLGFRELAAQLIPYVRQLGFTHIELLPVTEFPLDESWGYQTTGYFAPTSRHGSADDLRYFIDECHLAGIGVLLDWVPGHFPRDAHGLANFDGTALYEYPDPRKAEHRDWGTLIFNYERNEVRSFLLSSACYWLEEFHFDGLRVDAVASMLYLDFSRREGDFVANRYGGNHNLEAIDFMRLLNRVVHERYPGALVMAEESTDWPLVSRPVHDGGLGFSMKWNMGWMHDSLAYFREDPIYRQHHHEKLTFGMMYAYTENFILALSHDEVVHLKKSLLGKMPGDRWQQFANLRLLYTYQWTFPGKKLLFMGSEFGQPSEWDFNAALPWHLTQLREHAGVAKLLQDLNEIYVRDPRLHRHEFEPQGFRWIDCNDRAHSVISFLRCAPQSAAPDFLVVVLNFTPVPRTNYRIGVPLPGAYREVLNSDSEHYGGSNVGNLATVTAGDTPSMGLPYSLDLTLPPLGGIILAPVAAR